MSLTINWCRALARFNAMCLPICPSPTKPTFMFVSSFVSSVGRYANTNAGDTKYVRSLHCVGCKSTFRRLESFCHSRCHAIGGGRTMNAGGTRYHQPFTTLTIAVHDG